ncbi:hypothetical protein JOW46_25310, partial [Escherichia coli]
IDRLESLDRNELRKQQAHKTLEENKLLPDEQYTLLNTLSQQAFGERWLSTQESNALFLAARTLSASDIRSALSDII